MILADRITKAFGRQPLRSALSFRVDRGEMLALTGPGGAGKSTLLRTLADNGSAVVVATHSRQVEARCDRALTLGVRAG